MGKVTADPTTGQIIGAYQLIAGLEPTRRTGTTLYLSRGSVADRSGNVWSTATTIEMDITTVGPGGRDAGSLANGQRYQIYILLDNATEDLTAVFSASIAYGGVVYDPLTHTILRKLQFGFVYNTAWTGIPPFLISNWPNPTVTFTGGEFRVPWAALATGDASTWTNIDVSDWIPDAARKIHYGFRIHVGDTACSAYLRTSNEVTGQFLGQTQANGAISITGQGSIQVTSAWKLQYRVVGSDGDATSPKLSLYVLGYDMVEDS